MSSILGKTFKYAALLILIAELLSFIGFLVPKFGAVAFFFVLALVTIATLYKLEYGLLFVLAELFIGSKGYLFYFDNGSTVISIRIAVWVVVMSVWLSKVILNSMKSKRLETAFFRSGNFPYFMVLFLFVAWGLLNGLLNHNDLGNLLPDFKRWVYFGLIFPLYDVLFTESDNNFFAEKISNLLQVFFASTSMLSLKTFFLLYVFSHDIMSAYYSLYRWVRVTGVGEITMMPGGFYRIFMQSHIFILAGFFILMAIIADYFHKKEKKSKYFYYVSLLAVIFLSVVLISMSRSFWVGVATGSVLFLTALFKNKIDFKSMIRLIGSALIISLASFAILVLVVKFPYPKPTAKIDASDLLAERALQFSGEAGASSRWSLLPPLLSEIKKSPVLGEGFGKTVTYITSDPRILKTSPTGEYTTFSFEWGWLDIWLKLGLFGMLAYLILLAKIIISPFKLDKNISIAQDYGFVIALAAVCAVSFFSPYMNHPLGIGLLIITSALNDKRRY